MSELDPLGLPVIEPVIDMDDDRLEERRQKGRASQKIRDDIWARTDLTVDQKDELTHQALTSLEDTLALLRAGLFAKILAHAEEDIVPEFGPAFGEGFLVGVHWMTDQYTGRVYPDIYAYQMIDGEFNGMSSMVCQGSSWDFTPEELEVIAELADLKTYE